MSCSSSVDHDSLVSEIDQGDTRYAASFATAVECQTVSDRGLSIENQQWSSCVARQGSRMNMDGICNRRKGRCQLNGLEPIASDIEDDRVITGQRIGIEKRLPQRAPPAVVGIGHCECVHQPQPVRLQGGTDDDLGFDLPNLILEGPVSTQRGGTDGGGTGRDIGSRPIRDLTQ